MTGTDVPMPAIERLKKAFESIWPEEGQYTRLGAAKTAFQRFAERGGNASDVLSWARDLLAEVERDGETPDQRVGRLLRALDEGATGTWAEPGWLGAHAKRRLGAIFDAYRRVAARRPT